MCKYKKLLFLTMAMASMSMTVPSAAFAAESAAVQADAQTELVDVTGVLSDIDKYYLASAAFCTAHGIQVPEDIAKGVDEIYKNRSEAADAYINSMSDANAGSAAASATSSDDSSAETTVSGTSESTVSIVSDSGHAAAKYIQKEDGSALFYTVDSLTGEVLNLYNGWYTMENGDKTYFEDGRMQSGWIISEGKFYYLDPSTGVMVKSQFAGNFYLGEDGAALIDTTAPDGTKLAYNGSRMKSKTPIEALNDKTYTYRELLVKHPDLYAEFGPRDTGSYQIMPEKENGFSWYTYASMRLYERNADGSSGALVYEGDGCFRTDAVIEVKNSDGSIYTMSPSGIVGSEHETWVADHLHIDPAGFISYSAAHK